MWANLVVGIISAVIGMVIVLLFNKRAWGNAVACAMMFAISGMFVSAVSGEHSVTHEIYEVSHEVFSTDAPFGKYWTNIHGTFFLASGSFSTDLIESYTVKYMGDNNAVYTLIKTSSDSTLTVHLTSSKTMRYVETYQNRVYHSFLGETETVGNGCQPVIPSSDCTFVYGDLYIPNPRLFGNETG